MSLLKPKILKFLFTDILFIIFKAGIELSMVKERNYMKTNPKEDTNHGLNSRSEHYRAPSYCEGENHVYYTV